MSNFDVVTKSRNFREAVKHSLRINKGRVDEEHQSDLEKGVWKQVKQLDADGMGDCEHPYQEFVGLVGIIVEDEEGEVNKGVADVLRYAAFASFGVEMAVKEGFNLTQLKKAYTKLEKFATTEVNVNEVRNFYLSEGYKKLMEFSDYIEKLGRRTMKGLERGSVLYDRVQDAQNGLAIGPVIKMYGAILEGKVPKLDTLEKFMEAIENENEEQGLRDLLRVNGNYAILIWGENEVYNKIDGLYVEEWDENDTVQGTSIYTLGTNQVQIARIPFPRYDNEAHDIKDKQHSGIVLMMPGRANVQEMKQPLLQLLSYLKDENITFRLPEQDINYEARVVES